MNKYQASHQKNGFLLMCSVILLVVVTTMISATGKGVYQPIKESLSVSDARPVMLAAQMLENKYSWIITYEDPPWGESESVDVAEKVRRDFHKYKPGESPKVLVPKGGELSFEYEIEPSTKKPADSAVVVQQLLDAYAIAFNPAVFRLDRDGQRLHIIGTASKDKDGVLVPHQSVFDAAITLPAQKRNGLELLKAFCEAVSETNHVAVRLGQVPLNLLSQYQTESGSMNQSARDFLDSELDRIMGQRTFSRSQPKLSWQLLYSATDKAYFLNFHLV